jgi:hypothetical protein
MSSANRPIPTALFLLAILMLPLEGRSATQRPTVVTISKETTYITKPLRPDGYPDFLAALNQLASHGVTPENNAVVLLVQAFGPRLEDSIDWQPLSSEDCAKFFEMLGVAPPPDKGDYFVRFDDYVKETAPDALKDRDDKGQWQLPRSSEEMSRAQKCPWGTKECPLVAGWLAKNERPLQRLIEASRRPRYYPPAVSRGKRTEESGYTSFFPIMSSLRAAVGALQSRAMLRIHEGRVEQAYEDLQACHRLARLESQGVTDDESITATANERATSYGDWQLARFGQLTPEQAKNFRAGIAGLPPWPSTVEKMSVVQRLQYLNAVCAAASGRAKPDNIFGESFVTLRSSRQGVKYSIRPNTALAKWIAKGPVDWDEVLRSGNRHYDRIGAAARKPTWSERDKDLVAIDQEVKEQERKYRKEADAVSEFQRSRAAKAVSVCSLAFFPAWNPKAGLSLDREAVAQSRLAETAFALRAYRAERGEYPKRLSDLVPQYVSHLPEDPYGKGALRYRQEDKRCLVYSVGQDGVDDAAAGPFSAAYAEMTCIVVAKDFGIKMGEPSELLEEEQEAVRSHGVHQ